MSYVSWTEKLATGIDAIDDDHKALFDLVDQFHESYMSGEGDQALDKVFEALLAYTVYHFEREEKLMEDIGFPGLGDHRREHEELTAEVAALHDRYKKGDLRAEEKDLCLELMAFLNNWLHFHITDEDMKYKRFMEERKAG